MSNLSKSDLKKVAIFRGQVKRTSLNAKGAEEIKVLFNTLSDDAVCLLNDCCATSNSTDLDIVKMSAGLGMFKIREKLKRRSYIRSVITIMLDMGAMPNVYKMLALEFLEFGYLEVKSKTYIRKCVLYYLQEDETNPDFAWVDFKILKEAMKRKSADRISLNDSRLNAYFMSLYSNGHKAVKNLRKMVSALAAGGRPHNLAKFAAQEDRFFKIPDFIKDATELDLNLLLFSRLMEEFELSENYYLAQRPNGIPSDLNNFGARNEE